MAASVQCRPQNRDLGMVMREVDEDLAIYLGLRDCEKESPDLVVHESDGFDNSAGPETESSLTVNSSPTQRAPYDNFLNLENDRSDYDWLSTTPDSSLMPPVDMNKQAPAVTLDEILVTEDCLQKSEKNIPKPTNSPEKPVPSSNSSASVQLNLSARKDSSASVNKRPSSSGSRKTTPSRPATPTGRPTVPSKSKMSSRPSTPTSRASLPSSKPNAPTVRSSTPSRVTARTSTPTNKPSIVATSKSVSRSNTPTRKPSAPSATPVISASSQSSARVKTGPITLKNPMPSRGTFPTVKSRPSKPLDASTKIDMSQNSTTLISKRPASTSRGRPRATPSLTTSIQASSNGKPRRKSCSPTRTRAPNLYSTGSAILSRTRGHGNGSDYVNPVVMGTKMVERVVNMRKLAPPKQEQLSNETSTRKPSQDNSGFGRSLSKKSLDMAIRHMDIRRSTPDIAIGASVPSKSIRSNSVKSKAVNNSDSPLATSSSGSFEPSSNHYSHISDGIEAEEETTKEMGFSTLTNQQDE